jgi:hypothetical protein
MGTCTISLSHQISKINLIFDLVCKGVWGLIFQFEGTSSGSRLELNCEFISTILVTLNHGAKTND